MNIMKWTDDYWKVKNRKLMLKIDTDRDGIPDCIDCKPLDRKRQAHVYVQTQTSVYSIVRKDDGTFLIAKTEGDMSTNKALYTVTSIDNIWIRGSEDCKQLLFRPTIGGTNQTSCIKNWQEVEAFLEAYSG